MDGNMSSIPTLRVEVSPNQRLVDESVEDPAYAVPSQESGMDSSAAANAAANPRRPIVTSREASYGKYIFCTSTGVVQTLRRLISGEPTAKAVAFSVRPEIIWDHRLANRIVEEIEYMERNFGPWVVLASHGRGCAGVEVVSAHFNLQPDLNPSRGRIPIAVASGLLCVVNVEKVRSYAAHLPLDSSLEDFTNALIALGSLDGVPSYFSAYLFPCLYGRRELSIAKAGDCIERTVHVLPDKGRLPGAPNMSGLKHRLTEAFASLMVASSFRPRMSFVIRTIFNRRHLLNRCLISIDYIRRSLDTPVEIVISTDIDANTALREIAALREGFPEFHFLYADGRQQEGVSRVRNLVAGIKTSTGDRVCIIDDDDYYLPNACAVLGQVLERGYQGLLLLNAQIVNERWTKTQWKYQREITAYGTVYDSTEWMKIYTGENSLPLSSIVHPGEFIRRIVNEYHYKSDLSEDFVFHLIAFSHPTRPPITTSKGISVHQSHRGSSDNVSTNADRSGWCLDTGNGLFDLLFVDNRHFDDLSIVGESLRKTLEQNVQQSKYREQVTDALDSARRQVAVIKIATMSAQLAERGNLPLWRRIAKYPSLARLYGVLRGQRGDAQ
jgi:hypothetical protein